MYQAKIMEGYMKDPYIRFAVANRELFRMKTPNATFGEFGKIMGNAWRSLGADEKARYDTFVPDPMIEEAKRRVLTLVKDEIDRLKYVPTPHNASFVGEEYRATNKRWIKRNKSNRSCN